MMRTDIDYRDPKFRKEGFDKFYQFHIETNDCSPDIAAENWIADNLNFDFEKRCVMALFHGATYAGPCETMFADKFPVFKLEVLPDMIEFFEKNKKRLLFSPDCKYRKMVFPKFLTSVGKSIEYYGTLGQYIKCKAEYGKVGPNSIDNYTNLQKACFEDWFHWGRMGHWSFSEALDRFAFPLEAPTMEFGPGGKSHTSGWAFCMGLDHLVEKMNNDQELSKEQIDDLEKSANNYILTFANKNPNKLATFFTLETACCNYKRQNKGSRYGGCYIDEQYDEIMYMKELWKEYDWLWDKYLEARQHVFPLSLLFENFNKDGKAYMNSWCNALKDWGRIPRIEAYFNNEPQNWLSLEHQSWYGDDIFNR